MSRTLKRCPFCRGKAFVRIKNPNDSKTFFEYESGCSNSECHGFYSNGMAFDSEEQAAAAWNTRADQLKDEWLVCYEVELLDGTIYPASQLVCSQPELEKALRYWRCQAHNVHVEHRFVTDFVEVGE